MVLSNFAQFCVILIDPDQRRARQRAGRRAHRARRQPARQGRQVRDQLLDPRRAHRRRQGLRWLLYRSTVTGVQCRLLLFTCLFEAIEATRLPAITLGPCTRAAAGRRPLVAVVRSIEVGEVGVAPSRY